MVDEHADGEILVLGFSAFDNLKGYLIASCVVLDETPSCLLMDVEDVLLGLEGRNIHRKSVFTVEELFSPLLKLQRCEFQEDQAHDEVHVVDSTHVGTEFITGLHQDLL